MGLRFVPFHGSQFLQIAFFDIDLKLMKAWYLLENLTLWGRPFIELKPEVY